MSIAFNCAACGKSYHVKEELAGKKAKCKCGNVFVVPNESTAEDDILGFKEEVAAHKPPPVRPPPAVATVKHVATPAQVAKPQAAKPRAVAVHPALMESERRGGLRRFAYLALLLALAPLVWSTVVRDDFDPEAALEQTIEHHPEIAPKIAQIMKSEQATEEDLFNALPDHKVEGAWLSRDTWQHWFYALLSSAAFTGLLLLAFPKATESVPKLLAVGAFTATVGIFLLLGFQYVADWTQGFWLRGRGIIVLLFYIVKFIGFSYRAALDPETSFVLSALGFTFGVGLCEEICKSLPVLVHYQSKAEWPWKTACVVGLISGVGFGVSEGITYSSDFYNGISSGQIYVVRFVSCVALHAVWSGSAAIFIFRHHGQMHEQESAWGVALVWVMLVSIPMLLHGLYDTLLKKDHSGWALAAALVSFAWFAWQIEKARQDFDADEEDRAPAGRAAFA